MAPPLSEQWLHMDEQRPGAANAHLRTNANANAGERPAPVSGRRDRSMQPRHGWVRSPLGRWLLVALLGTLVCGTSPAWTDTAGSGRAQAAAFAASAASEPLAAVPLADLLAQADRDQAVVDRLRRQLARPDPSAGLSDVLTAVTKSVEDKRRRYSPEEVRQLAVMRLESLDRYWALDQRRLDQWQALATRRRALLADDAAVLERMRGQWAQALAAQTPVSPLLADRIAALMNDLSEAEQRVTPLLAHQIALSQEARELSSRIQIGREAVQDVIGAADQRMLQRQVPPLWALGAAPPVAATSPSPSSPSSSSSSAPSSAEQGLDLEASFATDYLTAAAWKVTLTTVLQLGLLVLMVWAAIRVRRDARAGPNATDDVDDVDADRAARADRPLSAVAEQQRLLSRPLSAWVLLGMLITLPLRTDAPLMTREVAMVLALVPALRLLPVSPLRDWTPLPQIFILLYALKWLCLLALDQPLLYRVLLMSLAMGALGGVWLALRHLRQGPLRVSGRRSTVLRLGGASAGLLLSGGALGQLTGHVTLGQTLINGVFDIAYLGLLLHLALAVVIALMSLIAAGSSRAQPWHRHLPTVSRWTSRVLRLAVNLGWALYAASELRVLRPAMSAVERVLGLRMEAGEISVSVGDLLVFAMSVVLASVSARLVRALLRSRLNDNPALPRGAGNSIASLSYYAVLMLGFMLALSAAGFKVSQLALVFGALGVGIGFGLQGIVSNFVSGLVLMFERPIQPGDMIEIGDIPGRVRQIGLRATVLRTADGADVVVPNSALLGGNLKNWTLFDRHRRIELPISVSYGSDVPAVLRTLDAVARATSGVTDDPPPVALFMGLGPSSMDFSLRVWTLEFDQWMSVRSDLLSRLMAAFTAAGIAIPFNQLDVNLRQVGETIDGTHATDATEATDPTNATDATPRT